MDVHRPRRSQLLLPIGSHPRPRLRRSEPNRMLLLLLRHVDIPEPSNRHEHLHGRQLLLIRFERDLGRALGFVEGASTALALVVGGETLLLGLCVPQCCDAGDHVVGEVAGGEGGEK